MYFKEYPNSYRYIPLRETLKINICAQLMFLLTLLLPGEVQYSFHWRKWRQTLKIVQFFNRTDSILFIPL